MKKNYFFIISAVIIFVLEWFQPLVHYPFFLFPVFVVPFLLLSRDNVSDLLPVVLASLFFDFFSGFRFGFSTLVILGIFLSIHLIKNFIDIDPRAPVIIFLLACVFVVEYILLFSILSPLTLGFSNLSVIFVETGILFIFTFFMFDRIVKTDVIR